jgi:hypothetical protein
MFLAPHLRLQIKALQSHLLPLNLPFAHPELLTKVVENEGIVSLLE